MNATEQRDFRVRAYTVARAWEFVRTTLGPKEAERILEGLSPETRHVVSAAKPADWCSVSAYTEVNDTVAGIGAQDEAKAREALIASGEFVAREATNTFLRLLMKMLNPPHFAKKLPDFWRRDATHGKLEVDVTSGQLVCRLLEMDGLNHVACTGAGFVKFALMAMGKVPKAVEIHNWSLAKPCTPDAWFEISWTE